MTKENNWKENFKSYLKYYSSAIFLQGGQNGADLFLNSSIHGLLFNLIVPVVGQDLKCSLSIRMNATLCCVTFWNGLQRTGTVPLPCERGLKTGDHPKRTFLSKITGTDE